VLLFDEIEKAHPDVFNLLLQILDDGRLTDSQGRVVDFRNTVIIMTSNIGSHHILEAGAEPTEKVWGKVEVTVREELRKAFRPEFLNRVDEVLVFRQLGRKELGRIVELQLGSLERMVRDRGLTLQVDAAARELLGAEGYDPVYGARPIKRVIQRRLQNPLALQLLEGKFVAGETILVGVKGEEITFTRAAGKGAAAVA
jgi:ATP-dependent Clp protease ATP-binding subunit ClpB